MTSCETFGLDLYCLRCNQESETDSQRSCSGIDKIHVGRICVSTDLSFDQLRLQIQRHCERLYIDCFVEFKRFNVDDSIREAESVDRGFLTVFRPDAPPSLSFTVFLELQYSSVSEETDSTK